MATAILIPAYEPDEKLIKLVKELKEKNFEILIVDDGSGEKYSDIFAACEPFAKVIGYSLNAGKGVALKYGMNYIKDKMSECDSFITADSDGQHSVADILRTRDELSIGKDFVLSVRTLRKDAPLKSRIGNDISRFLYAVANAHYLPDNQSGLRGFAVKHIDWMTQVKGEKYDYEMNVLLLAEKQGIKVTRLPIEAIYFDNNAGTHFKPLEDTFKIYGRFFETYMFSIISFIITLGLTIVCTCLWGYRFMFPCLYIGWGINALLGQVVERYTIFKNIKYTPGVRRLVFSIFRYSLYSVLCLAMRPMGFIPFWAAFLIAALITSFGEYYVLKIAYDN